MTKEQKIEAYAMLLDGYTMQAVGDKMGVSRQRIQQLFPAANSGINYIYPNIANWMLENRVSGNAFAMRIGVSPSMLSTWLRGIHDPRKYFIDLILDETGMTYEEAFSRKARVDE